MSFLHDVFFHNTRFEVSETTLAKLYPFAEYNRAIQSIPEVVISKIDESPNTNTLDFLDLQRTPEAKRKEFEETPENFVRRSLYRRREWWDTTVWYRNKRCFGCRINDS